MLSKPLSPTAADRVVARWLPMLRAWRRLRMKVDSSALAEVALADLVAELAADGDAAAVDRWRKR